MPITPKDDIEAIDTILNELYKDAIPYWFMAEMIRYLFDDSYYYELDRVLRKMNKLDLITVMSGQGEIFRPSHERFRISDYGIEIINEYGTYSSHVSKTLSSKKKEDNKLFLDRLIKNGNLIAALLISCLTLVLTQCPKDSSKEQQKIEQGLESVAKELDSLKQVLRNIPKQTESKPTLDTATNK